VSSIARLRAEVSRKDSNAGRSACKDGNSSEVIKAQNEPSAPSIPPAHPGHSTPQRRAEDMFVGSPFEGLGIGAGDGAHEGTEATGDPQNNTLAAGVGSDHSSESVAVGETKSGGGSSKAKRRSTVSNPEIVKRAMSSASLAYYDSDSDSDSGGRRSSAVPRAAAVLGSITPASASASGHGEAHRSGLKKTYSIMQQLQEEDKEVWETQLTSEEAQRQLAQLEEDIRQSAPPGSVPSMVARLFNAQSRAEL